MLKGYTAGLGTGGLMLKGYTPGLCRAPDTVAGIHAELAKHRALAVAVPGPAVVKIFPPPVNKLCSGISIC